MNWVIYGTGDIANQFARSIQDLKNHQIVAIVSRQKSTANEFINKHQLNALGLDYSTDISTIDFNTAYIATPHTLHKKQIVALLKINKNILCEKPMAISLQEMFEIKIAHQNSKSFLMEALWTVFQPATQKLKNLIQEHGLPISAECSLGFKGDPNKSRLFDNLLGGGALLDLGVYPIFMFRYLFGEHKSIRAASIKNKNLDTKTDAIFKYKKLTATMKTSIIEDYKNEFILNYNDFKIKVLAPWWHGKKIIKTLGNGEQILFEDSSDTFAYQIQEMEGCIQKKMNQSSMHSINNTLKNIEIIDQILINSDLSPEE